MKVTQAIILILGIIFLCDALQLSSDQQNHQSTLYQPTHKNSYFGRGFKSHKADQYVNKTVQENRLKIQKFNQLNQKKLTSVRSIGGAPSSDQVTGGNSFVMGQTKFIEFTQQEFQHLFTGLRKTAPTHYHHSMRNHESQNTKEQHKDKQIFNHHFLNSISPKITHSQQQMQSHFEQLQNHNADSSWSFSNPFNINTNDIANLYGSVNSNQNFGWVWQKLDPFYYSIFPQKQKSQYYSSWDTDHKGYNEFDKTSSSSTKSQPWYSGLFSDTSSSSSSKSGIIGGISNLWDDFWSPSPKPAPTPTPGPIVNPIKPNSNGTKPNPVPAPAPVVPTGKPIDIYPSSAVEVNWVKKNATTHIKDQGTCGSCWAYSAVGVIQSYYLVQGKGLLDLSEQQLVDCQKKLWGCDGGLVNVAFDWVIVNGLVHQSVYPYRGLDQTCKQKNGTYKIAKYYMISGRTKMEQSLKKGVLGGAVFVDDGFQFYTKGIFDACKSKTPNHAIVIVGYAKDYWMIRNSWGSDWGEQGHIRIKRDQNGNNACKIQDQAFLIAQ